MNTWLKRNWIAIVMAILFAASVLTYFIPQQESWFVWQRRLQAMATLLLAGIIFVIESRPPFPLFVTVGLFAVIGFIIGLVIQKLWQQKWWGKLIIAVVLIGNMCAGLLLISVHNVLVGPAYKTCEHFVTDSKAVRVVAYPEYGMLGGGQFFFLVTRDSGETWEEFMHFRHDDPVNPPCENIKSLNDQTFWAWMGWKLSITHDGGVTWQTWSPTDTWPDWQCCHYRLITNVDFQDSLRAYMQLTPIRVPTAELYSTDGGQTWVEELE